MKPYLLFGATLICILFIKEPCIAQGYSFEFYGHAFNLKINKPINSNYSNSLSEDSIRLFYNTVNTVNYDTLITSLLDYKKTYKLNDWLYYQLIRQTAQRISPKATNYNLYTLCKWFLLSKSGYDARLAVINNQLLFYVRCDEDISDIPFFESEGKQYVCLNYHDYGKIEFEKNRLALIRVNIPEAKNPFSYQISSMPDFKPEDYTERDIEFNYHQKEYHFKVKLNPEVATIFANYPVVDFASYFNIPLSHETYASLIPLLKKNTKGMNQKKGVDYLMHFTRYAFLYEDDEENFGKEKRLSPEQTLFYEHSDCDDRSALFFYLVKELYNLPMIALLYPTHITMAVEFNKPIGHTITYKGQQYSVCEPTPQSQNLRIGQLSSKYQQASYQIVYQYSPK